MLKALIQTMIRFKKAQKLIKKNSNKETKFKQTTKKSKFNSNHNNKINKI